MLSYDDIDVKNEKWFRMSGIRNRGQTSVSLTRGFLDCDNFRRIRQVFQYFWRCLVLTLYPTMLSFSGCACHYASRPYETLTNIANFLYDLLKTARISSDVTNPFTVCRCHLQKSKTIYIDLHKYNITNVNILLVQMGKKLQAK